MVGVEYLDKLFAKRTNYVLSGKYVNTSTRAKFRHSCGNAITCLPKQLMSGGAKCPCTHQKRGGGKFQTHAEFVAKLQQRRPDFSLLEPYHGSAKIHRFKHNCGRIVSAKAIKILTGAKKYTCEWEPHKPILDYDVFIKDFQADYGRQFKLLKYHGLQKPMSVQCTSCGDVLEKMGFAARRKGHTRPNLLCPCQFKKHGLAADNLRIVQQELDATFGKRQYMLGKDYTARSQKCRITHRCGKVLVCRPSEILRKCDYPTQCPCLHIPKIDVEEVNRWLKQAKILDFRCVQILERHNARFKHLPCGTKFERTRHSMLKGAGSCPQCHGQFGEELTRIPKEEMQGRVDAKHSKGEYKILQRRVDDLDHDRIKVKHRCGFIYEASLRGMPKGMSRCPDCFGIKGGKIRKIKIREREFRVNGSYEEIVLHKLVNKYGVSNVSCKNKNVPKFKYAMDSKQGIYTPDFYIEMHNRIIEVKSYYTLGLYNPTYDLMIYGNLERNQAKARAVIKAGYRFSLILLNPNKQRVWLPDNWLNMDRIQLVRELNLPTDGIFRA